MKNLTLFFLLFLLKTAVLTASEGMWLPLLLGQLNEAEMKSLGMKMSADDIYSVNRGSLKDAIISFGGFCTGEVISEKGLILTNHHCGYDAIATQSSLENNFLERGFWAKRMDEERPAAGLTATFIVRIEDVSAAALAGIGKEMDEKTRQSTIDKNLAAIRKNAAREADQDVLIRPFFDGNQFFLFITETFRDIRLVGAPPSSIGKFGSDTDNWVYPRHTGDFSMFRIYANSKNRPADYSKDNKPYSPKHFLPISLDGVAEGDFTLIFGFPGRAQEYLPSQAVEMNQKRTAPTRVEIRTAALGIIDKAMRSDPATKLLYAAQYASISNGWKKWQGEILGLTTSKAVEKRQKYEADFRAGLDMNATWQADYGHILPEFQRIYTEFSPFADGRDRYRETMSNCALLNLAAEMSSLARGFDPKNPLASQKAIGGAKESAAAFFKENRLETDQLIFAALTELFFKKNPAEWSSVAARAMVKKGDFGAFAARVFEKSILTKQAKLEALLAGPVEKLVKTLAKDPAVKFAAEMASAYETKVAPRLNELQPQISKLQRQYMAAQMVVFEGKKRFYPDANSTLRVGYGQVRGSQPKDGIAYLPTTYLDGVMEKYQPGDYEFDVPEKLISLWKSKDYGQYADATGRVPVCFIGNNHTTGGNSGSPAIDASGNLIGLNFDRVWEGTMSDINYDPTICRNVMVDARYILFIVDKFAGAANLIAEMKLVHPKK